MLNLKRASWLFVATWFVHTADHVRRGLSATTDDVAWAGTAAAIMAAIAVTLIVTEHPASPAVATAVFGAIAVGVSVTHLLPARSVLSDPILVDSTTDGWSIAAVLPEIAAAVLLAVLGWRILARNGYAFRIPAPAWV